MTATSPRPGYAPINGLELYYEIHGSGAPLVLLHGGLGSIEMYGEVLPALAAGRRVIAVDLHCPPRGPSPPQADEGGPRTPAPACRGPSNEGRRAKRLP